MNDSCQARPINWGSLRIGEEYHPNTLLLEYDRTNDDDKWKFIKWFNNYKYD